MVKMILNQSRESNACIEPVIYIDYKDSIDIKEGTNCRVATAQIRKTLTTPLMCDGDVLVVNPVEKFL
ncbi:MAG: hypothetical protein ABIR84_06750 [Candidatus Nitrotoga sp.]